MQDFQEVHMNRMIRKLPLQGTLATAVFAGLAGTAVSAVTDRLLDRLVSEKQKKQDRRVRKGTAHEMAGPVFMEKITGKAPDENEKKRARVAFSITYSLIWGVIYGGCAGRSLHWPKRQGCPSPFPFSSPAMVLWPLSWASPPTCAGCPGSQV